MAESPSQPRRRHVKTPPTVRERVAAIRIVLEAALEGGPIHPEDTDWLKDSTTAGARLLAALEEDLRIAGDKRRSGGVKDALDDAWDVEFEAFTQMMRGEL